MDRGTKSLLRRQSFSFSLEEISLKESILRDRRSGHQVDGSSQMPIAKGSALDSLLKNSIQ
jgi:hypothetical protein